MNEQKPTQAEWQALYTAMQAIKSTAPWKFMVEEDVFGVQNPETGETGFVSVMGMLGEHIATAVYLGEKALYQFWAVQEEQADPMLILETPQLQASFEDRDMVEKEDRAVMKQLGLKFRGRQSWPLFRSYRPGFVPWFLTAPEARFLTHVLEQTNDVTTRFAKDRTLLDPETDASYLIRVPEEQADGSLQWRDEIREVLPPEAESILINVDNHLFRALKQKQLGAFDMELDFFLSPAQVQEKKTQRPFFAYMLLGVDHESGFVYGFDMLHVETTPEDMLSNIPQALLNLLVKMPALPQKIYVQDGRTHEFAEVVCKELGIALQPAPFLSHTEAAKMSMFDFFGS